MPALTASAALFVGAAGVLLYNRLAVEDRKQDHVKEALPDNKKQPPSKQHEATAVELEAEIVQVDEKERADKGVATAVLESPVKTNGEASSAAGDKTDTPPFRNGSELLSKQDDVSTVGAPKIAPTAEERAVESPNRDESAEPSFISLLEQKTTKATENKPPAEEADAETEPSFVSYLQSSNKMVTDVKPEEESTEEDVVAKQPAAASLGVSTTTPEKAKEVSSSAQSLQAKSAPIPCEGNSEKCLNVCCFCEGCTKGERIGTSKDSARRNCTGPPQVDSGYNQEHLEAS